MHAVTLAIATPAPPSIHPRRQALDGLARTTYARRWPVARWMVAKGKKQTAGTSVSHDASSPAQKPGLLVEMWAIDRPTPYANNPRLNEAAVEAVAASIRLYGFRQPLVVDREGTIVAGHTRLRAAQRLGLHEVPVHVARDLTPEQARSLRIADNRTHELSSWNDELLRGEIGELQALNIDVNLLGFSDAEIAAILAPTPTDGLCDPDDVPLPPDEAATKRGDVWVLGEHRLMCGDSSSADDVDSLLGGAVIHLVNTDPPYNVKVEPRSNNGFVAGETTFHPLPVTSGQRGKQVKATTAQMRAKDRPLKNDSVSDGDFALMLRAWFGNAARVLIPGGGFYAWGGYTNLATYPGALAECRLYFSQAIVWDKMHPVLTRKDFMGAFEIAFYGWKEGAAHRYFGPSNATDLWEIKKVAPQRMCHLTEKPVELAKRAIEYSSQPGENVLDLFGGSGSTLIAAEMTGRRAFLMEMDALYCDVILARWAAFTGRTPVREGTGEPFVPAAKSGNSVAEEKAATGVAAGEAV